MKEPVFRIENRLCTFCGWLITVYVFIFRSTAASTWRKQKTGKEDCHIIVDNAYLWKWLKNPLLPSIYDLFEKSGLIPKNSI